MNLILTRYILLVLSIPFVFIACGKKETAGEDSQDGYSVRLRQESEPDRLSPVLTTMGVSDQVYQHIFQPLMNFNPETLDLEPVLVKSRPQEQLIQEGPLEGGIAYTFEILEDASWDDGGPVTATDYEFTVKAVFNPKVNAAVYRGYLNYIKKIEIDPGDPKKFKVYTHPSYINSLPIVSNFPVYPEHVYDSLGLMRDISLDDLLDAGGTDQLAAQEARLQQFADQFQDEKFMRDPAFISGSGPYRLAEWKSGQYIRLQKKEDWWGENLPEFSFYFTARPEELIFEPIADVAAAIAKLKSQEIDAMGRLIPLDFNDLKNNELASTNYNFFSPNMDAIYWLPLNTKSPKLSDKRVRRAVAQLIDMDRVVEDIMMGMATRISGPIMPNRSYFNDTLPPLDFDVETATQLLDEAGWTDSNGNGIRDKVVNGKLEELELRYLFGTSSRVANQIGLLLKDNAQKAGVGIDMVSKDFSSIRKLLSARDFEIVALTAVRLPMFYDPYQRFHTNSDQPQGTNYTGFGSAETDALIEELRIELDAGRRNHLYRKLQATIYDEQPAIFLFIPQEGLAVHKRFDTKAYKLRHYLFPQTFVLKDSKM